LSKKTSQWAILVALCLITLGACTPSGDVILPTLVPTAYLLPNPTNVAKALSVPPTFTAAATLAQDSGFLDLEKLEPTPTLKVTAAPSPTFVKVAAVYPRTVDVPALDSLPETVACDGPGLVFRGRFPSEVGGQWRNYHAYLPPCFGQDGRSFPVLYLVHGSIQSDSHWLELGLAEYADAGIREGRFPPFIAIMPNSGRLGNLSSGGEKSIEAITINSLIPFVDDSYCGWPAAAGRNIGGISRGGYWALEIAFRNPELFNSVSGHSSHLRFETDPAKYNPLATYATADLTDLRIWLDRGEKDFLRPGQEQLHANLESAGIAHEYRVNPGGHSDTYWADHIGEYLDWHAAAWPKDRALYPLCD
jgi:enterochelin esterase-like enzyme